MNPRRVGTRDVAPTAVGYLERRSVAVQVAMTREAVEIYNDLTDGTLVAGLFLISHRRGPHGVM